MLLPINTMTRKKSVRAVCTAAMLMMVATGLISPAAVQAEQSEPASAGSGGWKTQGYNAIPLKLSIQIGEESILQFPWRVEMGSSSEMLGMVRNVPIGDTIYLTPLMEFDSQRFWAESTETGAMMILDISATADAPPQMIRFVDARASEAPAPQANRQAATKRNERRQGAQGEYNYAVLSRFALQTLHSPERLIEPLDNLSEQPLRGVQAINDLVPGETVVADPVAEWRTGSGLFVTALIVTNKSGHSVDLDPRRLRHSVGWLSSAFWSTQLRAAGTFGDETTLIVIARSSWRDTVKQGGR